MVVNRRMNGGKFLQTSHAPKTQHRPFSPSKRLVGILASVVHPPAGFLLMHVAYDLHGCAIGSKFVRHDDMWVPIAFRCFPEEFQRCFAILALCNKGFQHFTLMVHCTPKIARLAVYLHKHLIQMPLPIGVRTQILDAITPDLSCEHWAKSIPPETYRFMTHVDAPLM